MESITVVRAWRGVSVSARQFAALQQKEQRRIAPKIRERLMPLRLHMKKAKVTHENQWLLLTLPHKQDESCIFGVALVQQRILQRSILAVGFVFDCGWDALRVAADVPSVALVKNEMRPILGPLIEEAVLHNVLHNQEGSDTDLQVTLPQLQQFSLQVVST